VGDTHLAVMLDLLHNVQTTLRFVLKGKKGQHFKYSVFSERNYFYLPALFTRVPDI